MRRLYCVCDFAEPIHRELTKDEKHEQGIFRFNKVYYRALLPGFVDTWRSHSFLQGVNRLPDFSIQERSELNGSVYLSIFLEANIAGDVFYSEVKQRLVSLCFTIESAVQAPQPVELASATVSVKNVNCLYQLLKNAHIKARTIDSQNLDHLQTPALRPTLRPYQLQAVRWMLQRERVIDYLTIKPHRMESERIPGQNFYMDAVNWRITDHPPPPRTIPSGGLLCDEMGLGKTVEMLSLILQNPREVQSMAEKPFTVFSGKKVLLNAQKKYKVRCICINVSDSKDMILCTTCKTLQHQVCVLKHVKKLTGYKCPSCWQGLHVESKATIIVSPHSIKLQWWSEIERHVQRESFKVMVYDGVRHTGWISPQDLAEFDVVLTDYTTLTSEIFYTQINQRQLRTEKKRGSPLSPLPMIKWWRSVLDEAQMVESSTTNSARMVQMLPAVHRWAVSGTPIEKHIYNLFGLIFFIGLDPYNNSAVWKDLVTRYGDGEYQPLIDVLQKVMWRTSKSDVLNQIGIPPQEEKVHYVTMGDLQKFYYRAEHDQYRASFLAKSMKYRGANTELMSAHMLKTLLEPLLKLRQDCTVPSVLCRGGVDQMNKKLLSPAELHSHLIAETEKMCRINLRTVVSSLNGQAGCHILRQQIDDAVKCYESVMRCRDEHVNGKKLGVDTLLQIHAFHNLLQIRPDHAHREQFDTMLKACETKFINARYLMVKEVHDRLLAAKQKIKSVGMSLVIAGDDWWRQILYDYKEDALNDKIIQDLSDMGHKKVADSQLSVRQIDLVLTTWLDELQVTREKILESFEGIRYFSDNIRATHTLNEDELIRHSYLIESAFKCHLNQPDGESDDIEMDRPIEEKCQLCRVKWELNRYECKLFNKTIEKDENVVGTWSPSYQEIILKSLLSFSKRDATSLKELGDKFFKLLDAIKEEFKEYSQYWVEINHSADAYDELNMCKGRLEAFDMDDGVQNHRLANQRIPRAMVGSIMDEFRAEKKMSETSLVQNKGRLKYLCHLKECAKLEPCPICDQMPEEKYAVLQCGHKMCVICTNRMAKLYRNTLTCAMCRHEQRFRDVLYVTCSDKETASAHEVEGSYSAKIINIVQMIKKITANECGVKIVIFSQWDNILNVLAAALTRNKITFASNRSHRTFNDSIQSFKDPAQKITCLLMALKLGSKGLNLVEATHVFLVEPILDPSEEKQAIGRVHRIGQTKPTFVHRFIMQGTVEEKIYTTCQNWNFKEVTVEDIQKLFELHDFDVELEEDTSMEFDESF